MDGVIGDLKVSIRQLAKAPGFAAAAVVVLAVGIGLNAAMFSMVYAIGFMGRPFAEPDRLMQLFSSQTREPDSYRVGRRQLPRAELISRYCRMSARCVRENRTWRGTV